MKKTLIVLLLISIIGCDSSNRKDTNSEIISAVSVGNIGEIKKLLDKGKNINSKTVNGITPLIWACTLNDVEVVKYLIKRGADIHIKDGFGNNAFINCCTIPSNHLKKLFVILEILLKEGTNINECNYRGETALTKAVRNGNINIVKFLLSKGADINYYEKGGNTPLEAAKFPGTDKQAEIVDVLLKKGARTKKSANYDEIILSPLFLKNDKILSVFIKNKVDINAPNKLGNTALILACLWGFEKSVKLLLECGADLTRKNKKSQTAIDIVKSIISKAKKRNDTNELNRYNSILKLLESSQVKPKPEKQKNNTKQPPKQKDK